MAPTPVAVFFPVLAARYAARFGSLVVFDGLGESGAVRS